MLCWLIIQPGALLIGGDPSATAHTRTRTRRHAFTVTKYLPDRTLCPDSLEHERVVANRYFEFDILKWVLFEFRRTRWRCVTCGRGRRRHGHGRRRCRRRRRCRLCGRIGELVVGRIHCGHPAGPPSLSVCRSSGFQSNTYELLVWNGPHEQWAFRCTHTHTHTLQQREGALSLSTH